MQHDLTIACTVFLPEGALLSSDKQTFTLNGEEYVLNTITFSSMLDDVTPLVTDLSIVSVEETLFEEVK
jgi:hypothetical protein